MQYVCKRECFTAYLFICVAGIRETLDDGFVLKEVDTLHKFSLAW